MLVFYLLRILLFIYLSFLTLIFIIGHKSHFIKKNSIELFSNSFPNCLNNKIGCRNHSECTLLCYQTHGDYKCIQGICRLSQFEKSVEKDKCNPNTGGKLLEFAKLYNKTCLCTLKEIFYGDNCSVPKAYFCKGGNVKVEKFKTNTSPSNYCICPKNSYLTVVKLKQFLEVPMCLNAQERAQMEKVKIL